MMAKDGWMDGRQETRTHTHVHCIHEHSFIPSQSYIAGPILSLSLSLPSLLAHILFLPFKSLESPGFASWGRAKGGSPVGGNK